MSSAGSAPKSATPTQGELESDRFVYNNVHRLPDGDLCCVMAADALSKGDGMVRPVIIKIPLDAGNNDLLDNEAHVLNVLRGDVPDISGGHQFVPTLVDTIDYHGHRHGNVVERADGYYTLEEVRAAYPEGVEPQAAGWIANRLFEALSILLLEGVVHGAILPPHVMLYFGDQRDSLRHTMRLVDWTMAIRRDLNTHLWPKRPGRIGRYVEDGFYPPEPSDQVTPATDLAMAAACVQYILPSDAPPAMKLLLNSCRHRNPDVRPTVLNFREEFHTMLDRHFGAGRFHYTAMPRV